MTRELAQTVKVVWCVVHVAQVSEIAVRRISLEVRMGQRDTIYR